MTGMPLPPSLAFSCSVCGAEGIFERGLPGGPALCEHPASDYITSPVPGQTSVGRHGKAREPALLYGNDRVGSIERRTRSTLKFRLSAHGEVCAALSTPEQHEWARGCGPTTNKALDDLDRFLHEHGLGAA